LNHLRLRLDRFWLRRDRFWLRRRKPGEHNGCAEQHTPQTVHRITFAGRPMLSAAGMPHSSLRAGKVWHAYARLRQWHIGRRFAPDDRPSVRCSLIANGRGDKTEMLHSPVFGRQERNRASATVTGPAGTMRQILKADVTEGPDCILQPLVLERLSPRQREVLAGIAQGLSVKEIAARMGLSTKTVETHRAALLVRTGLRNVVGLVLFAVYHGLVDVEHLLRDGLQSSQRIRTPARARGIASTD
jgi:DNA-binding CsgD family transcriptional regulator